MSYRCPKCGALVVERCLACELLNLPKPARVSDDQPLVLGLELRPEHYKRYLQVKSSHKEAESCDTR